MNYTIEIYIWNQAGKNNNIASSDTWFMLKKSHRGTIVSHLYDSNNPH